MKGLSHGDTALPIESMNRPLIFRFEGMFFRRRTNKIKMNFLIISEAAIRGDSVYITRFQYFERNILVSAFISSSRRYLLGNCKI